MPRLAVAVALSLLLAAPAAAQNYVARADTLFVRGRVFAAETLYYYSVRRQPRDPGARLALGRYLAARGALKVGAVLMEEARYFGGDPKTVATYLAPVYARLGDWKALASLPSTPLPYAERARAEWLRDNPLAVEGPDSATTTYTPADSAVLGRMMVTVGTETLEAVIDPRVQGLVLDTGWVRRPGVRVFKSTFENDVRNHVAVIATANVGRYALANVPARFEAVPAGTARIGLDVLASLAATFDPTRRSIVLRRSGSIPDETPGMRIPTLTYPTGMYLVMRDGVWPIMNPALHPALRGTRWTLNARRGEIVVGSP
jgi:hypothetical protein